VDGLIERIDVLVEQNLPAGRTFSGEARILGATFRNVVNEWRVNVRKLAMLARLQKGWDFPESQPLNRGAEANFLDWLATVPDERMDDAEPMLTDDGSIRLEWRREGYVRIAEIGSDTLYLAVLAPDHADDDAEESRWDLNALARFFMTGAIR
jgi:hypothetical protein